jgi:lactocepin
VSVTWKKVDGATGYKIYRANSASGKYKVVKTIKSGKTVKWTNSKLKKGKTYRYKIKAYRTVDGKKVYSPSYSAVVKAKAK